MEFVKNDYNSLATELERQELESFGNCSVQIYAQLLAIYLLSNDLPNSKFLWKRIPANLKQESPELKAIWEIGKKLWEKNISCIYGLIDSCQWPVYLSNIMKELREVTFKRAVNLISQSYSYITFEEFMKQTGITDKQEAINLGQSMQWQIDESFGFCLPKKANFDTDAISSNQEQLEKMTEYVAFLENY
ncbi:COP9 signalosome complex subunit 8-like protein [Leptotrombidium deliense]|uniref:COP9 signalosome complex subunit 8-like protein n=1 Tax=Leptotrombidium deliense TaxID=299467 RepID=A0A443SLS0_9ACAR|nr:COP9 signalosome complex subunit 8-like protein [Leptotrombidium deliense]